MSQPALTRDTICVSEMVLDSSVEQSIELDYFLPDYYPNIFKLLKTAITPAIQSQKVSGNQLVIDGAANLRVIYLAEGTNEVCCVTQSVPFSKTVELAAECANPLVSLSARCYFVNGRAVNQRRLDIRGGISCKARVMDQREESVLTGGSGAGLQCRPLRMSVCGPRKTGSRQFVVNEDLELGAAKPPFRTMIGYSANVTPDSVKIIANKAICKGELSFHLFYLPEGEGAAPVSGAPETMDFSIPISQIADLPGAEEGDSCCASFSVTGVSIEPKADENGSSRILNCEFSVTLSCIADKNVEREIVDDAYSTLYEMSLTSRPAAAQRLLQEADLTVMTRSAVESGAAISAVCDAWASFGDSSLRLEEGELVLSGNLEISAFCIGSDNLPFVLDKTVPTELKLLSGLAAEEILFLPAVEVLSCGYAILSENSLEIRAEIGIKGPVYEKCRFAAIADIAVNEEAPRPKDALCALRICYADAGDSVWDIAKAHSTSMAAVLEENNLEEERLSQRTMLLLPLIDG